MELTELLAQKAALEKQIADAQRSARAEAIAKVKSLMAEYGLTLADLSTKVGEPLAPKAEGTTKKVAPKYRDPNTGKTWTGRGIKPIWLQEALQNGKALEDFLIK
jgi:DNA-binding protein H-NS